MVSSRFSSRKHIEDSNLLVVLLIFSPSLSLAKPSRNKAKDNITLVNEPTLYMRTYKSIDCRQIRFLLCGDLYISLEHIFISLFVN